MIEEREPHELARGLQPRGEGEVFSRGRGVTRGVVMGNDERHATFDQPRSHDVPRLNETELGRAFGHGGQVSRTVLDVERRDDEALAQGAGEAGREERKGILGGTDGSGQGGRCESPRPERERRCQAIGSTR